MNLYLPGRKSKPASGYRLPLGDVVCDCWICNRPVYQSELSFCFADHAIRWVHRSCRIIRPKWEAAA